MRVFACQRCGNPLPLESTSCVRCGARLGFLRDDQSIVPIDEAGRHVDDHGRERWLCAQASVAACTWLAGEPGGMCFSCQLTRTRPHDSDAQGLAALPFVEAAKRRLILELDNLGLPVSARSADGDGVAFDLLSSSAGPVTTGHLNGVITIDVAESDTVHREKARLQFAEPYRTVLGHFRHEIGHYFESVLVHDSTREEARMLFGDERADYAAALERHHGDGPPEEWQDGFISAYATMHPHEDFAETFAHVMHIRDTVDTACATGLVRLTNGHTFRELVSQIWIPLSLALNEINGSMGKEPLYPFVIAPRVLDKLAFVASLIPRPVPA